jgi:hypothetical protein
MVKRAIAIPQGFCISSEHKERIDVHDLQDECGRVRQPFSQGIESYVQR